MQRHTIFLFWIFSINALLAQTSWQTEEYFNWDHTNFRGNQLFHHEFSTANPDYLLLDASIFYLTNEQRSKFGIPILPYHKLLEVAAYNHSMKMATTNFFSHWNTKDASRKSTDDRGHLAGVVNPQFAENIAYDYVGDGDTYLQVAAKLVNGWMTSPGHRSNILSENGKQMGAGAYYLDERIYGTQVFQWFNYVIERPAGGTDELPVYPYRY